MRITVLPSPLLGTATYLPVAAALAARGHDAGVAPAVGSTVTEVLAAYVDVAAGADLLVPHSNAGRFAAAVAGAVGGPQGARVVYVDALLGGEPPDPEWESFLRGLVQADGLLPRWTDWWPAADVEALLPDPSWRARLEAEEPRLPVDLLLTDPPTGPLRRSGYLAFGSTYDVQVGVADERGWPVVRLAGHHLHHLTDPVGVAAAVLDLAGRLDEPPGQRSGTLRPAR